MDSGEQAIEDAAELAQIRKQARKVHLQSLLLGAVCAAAITLIPQIR
jgi:hypothetical protein